MIWKERMLIRTAVSIHLIAMQMSIRDQQQPFVQLFILFISMFIIPEHEVFLFPEECILPMSRGTHP